LAATKKGASWTTLSRTSWPSLCSVSTHQGDEIGLLAVLEPLAGGGGLGIIAIQTGEKIATTDKGGTQGDIGHATALARLDQHARVERVHREAQHLATDRGDVRIEQCPEHGEEELGAFDGLRIGLVEPVKGG